VITVVVVGINRKNQELFEGTFREESAQDCDYELSTSVSSGSSWSS
jgi:hypothetical protein